MGLSTLILSLHVLLKCDILGVDDQVSPDSSGTLYYDSQMWIMEAIEAVNTL